MVKIFSYIEQTRQPSLRDVGIRDCGLQWRNDLFLVGYVEEAEAIISEVQAGFRKISSTAEQIFNLRILCEKHIEQQKEIHHCFVDFKKAFDRVWLTALWKIMEKKNIDKYLIDVIKALYNDSTSAVLINNTFSEWFDTTVIVRQGCLLSPTLFNIFLEEIMDNALEGFEPMISIGGRKLCNLRFADDIDRFASNRNELQIVANKLNIAASNLGMKISTEKTKTLTTRDRKRNEAFTIDTVSLNAEVLEEVNTIKYLGAEMNNDGRSERGATQNSH